MFESIHVRACHLICLPASEYVCVCMRALVCVCVCVMCIVCVCYVHERECALMHANVFVHI